MTKLLNIALFFCLTGCGMRGPLMLPPTPAPDPLFGKAKTGQGQSTPPDGSTLRQSTSLNTPTDSRPQTP